MDKKTSMVFLIAFLFTVFFTNEVFATSIDLSTFDVIDSEVYVPTGNTSAVFSESVAISPVTLLDFNLSASGANAISFIYSLEVSPGNEDYFDFYFENLSLPSDSFGGIALNSTLFYTGTITKYFTPSTGKTLSIAFAFSRGWDDVGSDSILAISNVELLSSNPVPEPATFFLLFTGIGVIPWLRRKKVG